MAPGAPGAGGAAAAGAAAMASTIKDGEQGQSARAWSTGLPTHPRPYAVCAVRRQTRGGHMHAARWLTAARARTAVGFTGPASADPPAHVRAGRATRGGPERQPQQPAELRGGGPAVRSIEASSHGAVEVRAPVCRARAGSSTTRRWGRAGRLLAAGRIHGNELHSTEAALQILKYLGSSGSAEARRIRDALTVVVIPMYNPDGATANIRQSTTPSASTSTATGRTSPSRSRARSTRCGRSCGRGSRSTCTTSGRRRAWWGRTS